MFGFSTFTVLCFLIEDVVAWNWLSESSQDQEELLQLKQSLCISVNAELISWLVSVNILSFLYKLSIFSLLMICSRLQLSLCDGNFCLNVIYKVILVIMLCCPLTKVYWDCYVQKTEHIRDRHFICYLGIACFFCRLPLEAVCDRWSLCYIPRSYCWRNDDYWIVNRNIKINRNVLTWKLSFVDLRWFWVLSLQMLSLFSAQFKSLFC